MKKRILFVVGPTAVGKTEVAVSLARKINAEIISCDSMQLYKGMGIITSKPSKKLRKRVVHHLLDVVSPTRDYNVSRFRREALNKIKEIVNKGKVPLLVGGTGLYMSILLDGIFKAHKEDKATREKLYREAVRYGSAHLHKKLLKVDPEAAQKIHPNDTKRMVRALEVFAATGKPISQLQKQRIGLKDEYDSKVFCLDMPRVDLYARIDKRVEEIFKKGLIKEVRGLLKMKLSRTASCAIGIKELKGYFEGLYDLVEVKRLMKCHTRRYAKRQLTWFRKDKRLEWVMVGQDEKPASIAKRIGEAWNAHCLLQ